MKDFFQKYKKIFQTPNAVCGVFKIHLLILCLEVLLYKAVTHTRLCLWRGQGIRDRLFITSFLTLKQKQKGHVDI